jgi:hypothetical protein
MGEYNTTRSEKRVFERVLALFFSGCNLLFYVSWCKMQINPRMMGQSYNSFPN